jgi:hypothetical protein
MIASASETREQVRNGFVFALGHQPSDAELNVLVSLYDKVSPVRKVSKEPIMENEAMTLVASAIMNLDEFITKN